MSEVWRNPESFITSNSVNVRDQNLKYWEAIKVKAQEKKNSLLYIYTRII